MPEVKKNTTTTSTANKGRGLISAEVGNYEKHPFFVKKANDAKAFLKKAGLPSSLTKRLK